MSPRSFLPQYLGYCKASGAVVPRASTTRMPLAAVKAPGPPALADVQVRLSAGGAGAVEHEAVARRAVVAEVGVQRDRAGVDRRVARRPHQAG